MQSSEEIQSQLESFQTLGQILQWSEKRTPRAEFVDLVALDEFTNDLVVQIRPDLFAVFDTT